MSACDRDPAGDIGATISASAGLATYVQVWRAPDADAQRRWLEVMRKSIHILRAKPGFVSMTLHVGADGTRLAVYAQWTSAEALTASLSDPAAITAHDRMAAIAEPDGALYDVADVYGPLSDAGLSEAG